MIRAGVLVLALLAVLLTGNDATAQQDGNGNGLIEVCVRAWGHMGEQSFLPKEVTLEELEEIAVTFHTEPFQGNADGTCPPLEQAQSLEIVYCVWASREVHDETGVSTSYDWQREWHSLPYFIQDFQTNGANLAPIDEYGGCPTEPPSGVFAQASA